MPKSKRIAPKKPEGVILHNPILYKPVIYLPTIINEDVKIEDEGAKAFPQVEPKFCRTPAKAKFVDNTPVEEHTEELILMDDGTARDTRDVMEKTSFLQRIFGRKDSPSKDEVMRIRAAVLPVEVMQPDPSEGSEAMLGQPTKKAKRIM